ncbi:MAG: ABC transporter substrate-binding protein [Alphaproteobacteria bacterium]|nr:ABC transporter substrate-binding protein [Alphaproteobacteria bacterium]
MTGTTPTRLALALAGLIAALAPGASAQEPPKPRQIVVNVAGGDTLAATRRIFFAEYEKRYGIRVVDSSPTNFAKLRAMVESGNIEWTVTEIGGEDAVRGQRMNLFEPIDRTVVPMDELPSPARDRKVTLARGVYSTVLAYRKDAFKPGAYPTGWKDFWDVKGFPGPRSMRNRAIDNLEFALIADGVPVDKLYPLDVDRAFKKLDEIKPHVAVWWSTGQQPAQLLIDREVVMTTGWNGRFYKMQREEAGVDVAWPGAMVKVGTFGVVKGTANAYWGQKLLAVFLEPKLQAAYAEAVGYPGTNPKGWEFIDKAAFKYFPTSPDNLPYVGWTNDEWWADNGAAVEERFSRWLLAR